MIRGNPLTSFETERNNAVKEYKVAQEDALAQLDSAKNEIQNCSYKTEGQCTSKTWCRWDGSCSVWSQPAGAPEESSIDACVKHANDFPGLWESAGKVCSNVNVESWPSGPSRSTCEEHSIQYGTDTVNQCQFTEEGTCRANPELKALTRRACTQALQQATTEAGQEANLWTKAQTAKKTALAQLDSEHKNSLDALEEDHQSTMDDISSRMKDAMEEHERELKAVAEAAMKGEFQAFLNECRTTNEAECKADEQCVWSNGLCNLTEDATQQFESSHNDDHDHMGQGDHMMGPSDGDMEDPLEKCSAECGGINNMKCMDECMNDMMGDMMDGDMMMMGDMMGPSDGDMDDAEKACSDECGSNMDCMDECMMGPGDMDMMGMGAEKALVDAIDTIEGFYGREDGECSAECENGSSDECNQCLQAMYE